MITNWRAHLGSQTLEKRRGAFVLEKVFYDGSTADFAFEVGILYAGLDGIERSRDRDGSDSTCDRSNEVLRPGRLVIVHEASITGGVGAEIAAEIQKRCFLNLKAPVKRVAAWEYVCC